MARAFATRWPKWASSPLPDRVHCQHTVASTSRSRESEDAEVDPFVSEMERRDLLSSSESDSEGDSDCEEPPAKRKFTPGEDTIKLLKQAAEKPLKNDKRKAIAGKFPLPSCDAAHPPRLDDSLNCLVPKSAKTYDRFLSKLQQFSMDALGPLAFIQNQLDTEAFFASSDSKYKSQSRRQQWGVSQPSQKSVFKRLGPSQTRTTGAHHFKKPPRKQ